ncbi:hypothetical protein TD95_002331 [Thielaviopsis punctulata]|uniref:Xaa-Pro aminopeptidase n=1 Tax=Thielaviopsis punctulata TaxID=72032 RepID=A0A0F4ZDZ4_9PEZI|nr:hypothetical protein TD95_002331 [Thielaviopsis punctulata]
MRITATGTTTPARMENYEAVLQGKYPAKAHARRVAKFIAAERPAGHKAILYLEGRQTKLLEDNDEPEPFRTSQRRAFFYLTGCKLADCFFLYDSATDHSTLFIPPIDPDSVIWSGLPMSVDEAKAAYDVDDVKYTTDLDSVLASHAVADATLHTIPHTVSVGGITSAAATHGVHIDEAVLHKAVDTCRVVKDEYELALIKKANMISTTGHHEIMKRVKAATNEQQLEAVFLERSVAHGAKDQAYHSIVATGRAAATLHYVKNDQPMAGKLNLLLDAGCEWDCYASDITRTFPISGSFSPESRAIYDIVLRMQLECIAMLKEGVLWDDVHLHAHKVAIAGLHDLGILKGDRAAILAARTSVAFFPHGLGHYLGMDTHDTGGNPNYADSDSLFRYLRVRGTLPAGSVITVEPGVYFCNFIIEPYLKDDKHKQFIDEAVLEKYWDVGGVRIEDNLVITKDGSINLTNTVKEVDEMLALINGA